MGIAARAGEGSGSVSLLLSKTSTGRGVGEQQKGFVRWHVHIHIDGDVSSSKALEQVALLTGKPPLWHVVAASRPAMMIILFAAPILLSRVWVLLQSTQ